MTRQRAESGGKRQSRLRWAGKLPSRDRRKMPFEINTPISSCWRGRWLRDPYWPYRAAVQLGDKKAQDILPIQYARAVKKR